MPPREMVTDRQLGHPGRQHDTGEAFYEVNTRMYEMGMRLAKNETGFGWRIYKCAQSSEMVMRINQSGKASKIQTGNRVKPNPVQQVANIKMEESFDEHNTACV